MRRPAFDRRFGFSVGLALIAAYAIIQTIGVGEQLGVVWTAIAVGATILSPVGGLTIVVALGPFTGALADSGAITAMPFLLAALGASVIVHAFVAGYRPRLRWPDGAPERAVVMAGLLMVVTALGVALSYVLYGSDRGVEAAQLWVPGIGGGLTVFCVAAWIARSGDIRPLGVLTASVTLAAIVCLIDFATVGGVNATPLGWLLHDQVDTQRLSGIILAPNAAAAIFLAGVCVGAAFAVADGRRGIRITGAAVALICLVAVILTFSRSALVALALIVMVVAWRATGWRGVAAAISGLVVIGATYVLLTGMEALEGIPGIADQQRLDAWGAAFRMWLDRPLTGAGFRAFEWLHADYGSPLLDAPHNEWLRLLAEEGIVGGLLGIALVGFVLRSASGERPAALAGLALTAAFVAMSLFNNPLLYVQVNVPVFAVLGFAITRSRAPR